MVFENSGGVPQVPKSFGEDRLGEDHRRCGVITYLVIGLHRDLSHCSCAEVLNLFMEEYVFGDGNSIVGNGWRAISHANENVATTRT